jgi:nucleoside-diphosphate-sugar epimerase
MSEKLLITGATGFLGSHLAELACRDGLEVRALVRRTSRVDFLRRLGLELCEGSLEDAASLQRALQDCSAVVHCAGAIKARNAAEFEAVNTGGTRRLLEAAASVGTVRRFVLVSSLAAHGPSDSPLPRPVDAPGQPVSGYGRSKLAAER